MALSFSRRLLRRLGSFSAFSRCESPSFANHSSPTPRDSYGVLSGDNSFATKGGSCLLACRKLSTTILTPDSSDGAFPSDLLSKKTVLTPDRTIGHSCHISNAPSPMLMDWMLRIVKCELALGMITSTTNSSFTVSVQIGFDRLCQDLVIPVTNFLNEDKGFMVLAGDVFDVPIRKDIIHRVVRWQLAKRQQGTHSTKTISEVSGTGRKPWNQKGTGRARHGTLRGPQFRGGAIMHGPKPRSHAIKLNKKVRRLGLKIALSARAAEGKASLCLSIMHMGAHINTQSWIDSIASLY
ncbi:hypothetical protein Pint_09794 [Pistacia integerrima]|uniref:Uncharacterized protein n=1 Tax=Pistacia integerrima TaxID=434235 RepID=A0ACC0XJH5_9ROSI|nr:hypothetical protein Pint_09794 [Pistacia integerrima]